MSSEGERCSESHADSLLTSTFLLLLSPLRATNTADKGAVTTPTVKIDNIHDPFATLVMVDVGSTLEMFDTIQALKNLGLNIRRAKLEQTLNTFYITEASTSEKIVKSARLEEIRMTVLNSLESKLPAESFITGESGYGTDDSKSKSFRGVVQTTIDVSEASNGSCSVLKIKTADRPGLLVDIVRVLKDINLNVVSAEVDTVGAVAQDEFFITYRGEPLTSPMITLVTNALQYYLSLAEVATQESY
jgi:UTP:GlnB (protein PII) uridylyltransferase